jgi:rubrerythrin
MSVFKNPAEIIEIAIRIERNGVEFYRYLSENVEDNDAKDVFSFLAAQEEKHVGIFRKMLYEVADYTPKYSYPGEYGLFLDELAGSAIDSLKNYENALKTRGFQEAIKLGIEAELQTIVYFTELYELLPDKVNEALKNVIDEEKKHYLELKIIQKQHHFK